MSQDLVINYSKEEAELNVDDMFAKLLFCGTAITSADRKQLPLKW